MPSMVRIPLEGYSDFHTWSIQMKELLAEQDLQSALTAPTTGPCNDRALALIQLSCEPVPLMKISRETDCRIAWQILEKIILKE